MAVGEVEGVDAPLPDELPHGRAFSDPPTYSGLKSKSEVVKTTTSVLEVIKKLRRKLSWWKFFLY